MSCTPPRPSVDPQPAVISPVQPAAAALTAVVSSILSLFLAGPAGAGPHTQTDWSGGGGEPGPVSQWSDGFDMAAQISWRSVPGQVVLSSVAVAPGGDFVTDDAPNCQTVAAGDLDGDGDRDLMTALPLTSFPGTGKVRWYENAGDGTTWTEHEVDDDFYGGYAITAADLDGDDDLDIVASAFYDFDPNDRNGRYVWYENIDGDAGSWAKHFIAGGFWGTEMVATADMDDDGDPDVYGASTLTYIGNTNDDIYWFENVDGEGGSWVQHAVEADFPDAIEAVAEDIDRDGDLDIACVAYGTHDLAWWENEDGDGVVWTKHVISDFTVQDVAIDMADLDDDGDVDIAAVGVNSVNAAWWENEDGVGGSWTPHVIGAFTKGADVNIADLDGDGLLDVLAASSDIDNSRVAWFRNLGGAAAWGAVLVNLGHDQGEAAIPADLNGDGALEVVFTEEGSFAGDISGLHWRRISSFRDSGELDSAVLDADSPATWTAIDWTAATPPSTSLSFQVRSSNDPNDLGPWSADITSPGSLEGILDPDTRYVQYKVLMSSEDSQFSPRVLDVTMETEGASGVPDAGSRPSDPMTVVAFDALRPNPTSGSSTAAFTLGATGRVRLDVLDVSGRRVGNSRSGILVPGAHEVSLPRLPTGVYLVRLSAGGAVATQKLVVR